MTASVGSNGTLEVWCHGGYSTGFAVGPRHVLTALHTVADNSPSVEQTFTELAEEVLPHDDLRVRQISSRSWLSARLVWPCPGTVARSDLALLEVEGLSPGPTPRWGRATTTGTVIRCETVGVPAVHKYPTSTVDVFRRDVEHVLGSIVSGTGRRAGYLFLQPDQALEPAGWKGMSGAAVHCEGLLTAVVIAVARDKRRLVCQSLETLASDASFCAALGYRPHFESVELEPYLASFRLPTRAPFSPAALLRAQTQAVAFCGREDELRRLHQWCDDEDAASLMLLTGPGGQGKSRLAVELMSRLDATWVCGQLGPVTDPDALAALLARTTRPTLLVVDYTETRHRLGQDSASLVEALAAAAARSDYDARIRVLLIARAAGDWWVQTVGGAGELAPMLQAAPELQLTPLAGNSQERRSLFDISWRNLAQRLNESLPAWSRPVRPEPDLAHGRHNVALLIQMEALASLLEPHGLPGAATAADVILIHEEPYWRHAARAAGIDLHPRTLRHAVAAASLFGAMDENEGRRLVDALPDLEGSTADTRLRVVMCLKDLYPGVAEQSTHFLGALQPDLLAEHLIAEAVMAEPLLIDSLTACCSPGQARRALSVLARAALHRSGLDEHLTRMVHALGDNLPEAVHVVSETENPGQLLSALRDLDRKALPLSLLQRLADAVPLSSARLAAFAADLQSDITTAHRRSAEHETSPTAALSLARSLRYESSRLLQVGQKGAALRLLLEAQTLLTALTDDFAEHQVERASWHVSMAQLLPTLGRPEEALTHAGAAFTLLCALDDADIPPEDKYQAMGTLGLRLAEAGQHDDAVALLAAVVEDCELLLTGVREFQPADQSTLIAALTLCGRWRNNFAVVMRNAGRMAEADAHVRRAASIRQELVELAPEAHLASLSLTQMNLAGVQYGLDDEAALRTAEDAMNALHSLVLSNPSGHLPQYLAAVHNVLTLEFQNPGPGTARGRMINDLVRLYGRLRQDHPTAYLPILAISLPPTNADEPAVRAHIVLDEGTRNPGDARQADEAVALYRSLLEVDHDFYELHFAQALAAQACRHTEGGRHAEAEATWHELVEVQRRRAQKESEEVPLLLHVLQNAMQTSFNAENFKAAAIFAREAVDTLRLLPDEHESRNDLNLACALHNLFNTTERTSDGQLTLTEIHDFARLCLATREIAPAQLRKQFATELYGLALLAADNDQIPDAIFLVNSTLVLYRTLHGSDGANLDAELSSAWFTYSRLQTLSGMANEASLYAVYAFGHAQRSGSEELAHAAWMLLRHLYRTCPSRTKKAWRKATHGTPFPKRQHWKAWDEAQQVPPVRITQSRAADPASPTVQRGSRSWLRRSASMTQRL